MFTYSDQSWSIPWVAICLFITLSIVSLCSLLVYYTLFLVSISLTTCFLSFLVKTLTRNVLQATSFPMSVSIAP